VQIGPRPAEDQKQKREPAKKTPSWIRNSILEKSGGPLLPGRAPNRLGALIRAGGRGRLLALTAKGLERSSAVRAGPFLARKSV